jgi:hypothetical protein
MLPPCEPIAIRDALQHILDTLLERASANEDQGDMAPGQTALPTLATALVDALDALARRIHAAAVAASQPVEPDLEKVGDHVIDLIDRLAQQAQREQAHAQAQQLRGLLLAVACCVVRGGGELTSLRPVVSAAAEHAHQEHDAAQIRILYQMTDDIARGMSARCSGAAPDSERFQAWRVLLINRAIIATRTLDPKLMEAAFEALLEELPADAPAFFREGMRQMALLSCPSEVREVMRRYHETRTTGERLH